MIRTLLIDDEPLALKQLEAYAATVPFLEVCAACYSARAALPFVEEADLLVLDINMPDMNGLELVKSLTTPPLIVFTTAYPEYAVEGFRVNAADYLLKPFGQEDFRRAMEKVRTRLEERRAAESISRMDDALLLKMDYKTVRIMPDEINYVESMSEYLKIFLKGRETPLIVLYSLSRLAEQLPADRFARVHRSYLVNLSQVRQAGKTALVLENGVTIPIGEKYRPNVFPKPRRT